MTRRARRNRLAYLARLRRISEYSRQAAIERGLAVLVSIVAPPQPDGTGQDARRGVFFIVKPGRGQLESIARLVESGDLTPVVARVMPLADARAAYEGLKSGHRRGKVVLHVAD